MRHRTTQNNTEQHRTRGANLATLLATFSFAWLGLVNGADAQITQNAGGFRVEFWNQSDGAFTLPGGADNVAAGDVGTWTAAEMQSVVRALAYWSDTLNLPAADADSPIYRVVKDEGAPNNNAAAFSGQFNDDPITSGDVNSKARLVDDLDPNRPFGIDGYVIFKPGHIGGNVANPLNTYDTSRTIQLVNSGFNLQKTAIHEFGHLLGFTGANQSHVDNTTGNGGFVNGANSLAVHGGSGVPLEMSGVAHTNLDFHNLTRAQPFGNSFRNITAFAPGELAVYADMGYDAGVNATLNLNEHFGYLNDLTLELYQDGNGVLETLNNDHSSTKDYAYGLFLQADDRNVLINGDIDLDGFAATGVRLSSTDMASQTGNTIAISQTGSLNLSGDAGIGILVSGGGNNTIIHRGEIIANGTESTGIYIGIGRNNLSGLFQVTSRDFEDHLVDQLDITGEIIANGNAIFIDQFAAVQEINLMGNAALSGNIVSNALSGGAMNNNSVFTTFDVPVLTFGKTADADGRATNVGDSGFNFFYSGDISGSSGRANLDLHFIDGTTLLAGSVSVQDTTVTNGQLIASGPFQSDGLKIEAGSGEFQNVTNIFGDTTVDTGSLIATDDFFTFALEIMSGDASFSGETFITGPVNIASGSLNTSDMFFTTSVSIGTGMFQSTGMSSLGDVDLSGGKLDVATGSTLADSLMQNSGETKVGAGAMLDVTGAFNMIDGVTTVAQTATLEANAFTMHAGQTNVAGMMDVDTIFDAQGGVVVVNGQVNAQQYLNGMAARLQGDGVVQTTNGLANNGTIAPGNSIGTMTIVGDLDSTPTGEFEIEISPLGTVPGVHNDLVQVTGNATVNGGTVEILDDPGTYAVASQYTFLTANQLMVPTLPTIVENINERRLINFIDNQSYSLLMARDVPYVSLGETFNQRNFGMYLDDVKLDPDAQFLRDVLDLIPDEDEVRHGFDQLSGEIYGDQLTLQMQSNSHFLDMIANVTRSSYANCNTFYFAQSQSELGSWNSGFGFGGSMDSDGNARGVDYSGGGTAVGIASRFSPNWVAGAFYGFENLNSEVDQLRSRIDTDIHRFGLYSEWRDEYGLYVRGASFAGFSNSDSSRSIDIQSPFFGISETTQAGFSGSTTASDIELGQLYQFGFTDIQPLAGLRHTHIHQNSFRESGGVVTNLAVGDTHLDSLRSRLGVRVSHCLKGASNTELSVDTVWQHELLSEPVGDYRAAFRSADGSSFVARGVKQDRGRIVVTPGVTWTKDWIRVSGQYRMDANSMSVLHSGNGVVEFLW